MTSRQRYTYHSADKMAAAAAPAEVQAGSVYMSEQAEPEEVRELCSFAQVVGLAVPGAEQANSSFAADLKGFLAWQLLFPDP